MSSHQHRGRRQGLLRRLAGDVQDGKLPGYPRLRREAWLLRARARALTVRPRQPDAPEIHVFVIWSRALDEAPRILTDIEQNFVIRDVFMVEWSKQDFSRSLTRFYGGLLPDNAEKETHCGTDPFLVAVVEDRGPVYAPRRSPKASVNVRTFDAKQRYRSWTGGGHRIHASVDPDEAERDLFLLTGRRPADYLRVDESWNGVVSRFRSGPTGGRGWRHVTELMTAIELSTPYVQLFRPTAPPPARLTLLVENRVRAALTANARPRSGTLDSELHDVTIGGSDWLLELLRVGDGSLDDTWQRTLLRERVRDGNGAFVPAAPDAFFALLNHALLRRRPELDVYQPALEELAREAAVSAEAVRDPVRAEATLAEYLRLNSYSHARPTAAGTGGRPGRAQNLIKRLGGRQSARATR